MVYGALPFELIVIVRGGLSVLTATFPKSMPGGEIKTDGTNPMVKTGDENSEVSTGVLGSCIRVASREKLSAVTPDTTTLPAIGPGDTTFKVVVPTRASPPGTVEHVF